MSNGWKLQSCFGAIPRPRETEAGSAGKQLAKGYLGLRCANGVSGPCRDVSTRAGLLHIGHRSYASENPLRCPRRALESDEPFVVMLSSVAVSESVG